MILCHVLDCVVVCNVEEAHADAVRAHCERLTGRRVLENLDPVPDVDEVKRCDEGVRKRKERKNAG